MKAGVRDFALVMTPNALAESVIGLFKTEVIWSRGPWRGLEDVGALYRRLDHNTVHRSVGRMPT